VITIDALAKLRALVVGLGREGLALATYLAKHGLSVTATDLQPPEKWGDRLAGLAAAGVSLVLGEHPPALLDQADILFVSPGVPLETPVVAAARARQLPLCTESKLFCLLCPAPIIGVTGSNGKTTTTTLTGQMVAAAGRKVWVGGNIGQPLIDRVDQIAPDDVVVMELSSFQLEYFHAKLNEAVQIEQVSPLQPEVMAELLGNWSPPLSAILNITPNHLDRHPTMKHYVRAKRALINYQPAAGKIIMNLDNDMTRTIGRQFGSKTRWFSLEAQMTGGACLARNQIVLIDDDHHHHPVVELKAVKLRGVHNLANILAACLLSREMGVPPEAMRQVITTFSGVEHRLQWVRERNGVNYYNDSIATSPERLAAALRSFDEPIVLVAGGRDKHLPWEEVARLMVHKTAHVILFGEASPLIAPYIQQARAESLSADTEVHQVADLEAAVRLAAQLAQAGQVVLLSPGCTSFDMFSSFVERGERYIALVSQL
jgi:UDP-N-acetylmuramoylalanine--D-glutamate ligase